jgi:hypothetical protein
MGTLAAAVPAVAQSTEPEFKGAITPFFGYQFGGAVDAQQGRVFIDDAQSYGAFFDFRVGQGWDLELSYHIQQTELRLEPRSGGPSSKLADVAVQYIQFGVLATPDTSLALRPFVGITGGVVIIDPDSSGLDNAWRGAAVASGGIRLRGSERVSLRVQSSLLMLFFNPSSTVLCTTGGGCGSDIGWRVMLQGEALAGLTVKF